MKKRITKRAVDALQPGKSRKFLWDTDVTGFGAYTTPKGTKTYVFQYRVPGLGRKGQTERIRLGRHGDLTPSQARKIAADLLLEVRSGGNPAAKRRHTGTRTVQDLAKKFLEEYLPRKKRPPRESTIKFYETLFRVHILPRLGKKAVDTVTSQDVERLHTSMKDKPYVANRVLSLIQYAFDQAEKWEWREQRTNPALHIDKYPEEKRGDRKEVMLDAEQMSNLLAAIDEEEQAGTNPYACSAIRLAFWTGWRIGEVLRLEWSNVDLGQGVARLVQTKTRREEYRHLPEEAVNILRGLPRAADSPFVLPGDDLERHLTTVRRPWKKIRKRAGLDDLDGLGALRIHDLRHNVVSWDVSRGVPLEIAGKNVGHRSRRSTEVYAHFAPTTLKRAADERAQAMRDAMEQG